jgi:predicted transcriptional regulator
MVQVRLDAARERRLRELAESRGQDVSNLVRTVLEDYLDLEARPADTEEDWAESSMNLASEVLEDDAWNGGPKNGSR